jgi:hypothetical protein
VREEKKSKVGAAFLRSSAFSLTSLRRGFQETSPILLVGVLIKPLQSIRLFDISNLIGDKRGEEPSGSSTYRISSEIREEKKSKVGAAFLHLVGVLIKPLRPIRLFDILNLIGDKRGEEPSGSSTY